MNRKHFFSSLLLSAFSLPSLKGLAVSLVGQEGEETAIIPHYLKNGDTIGIVCPAGYITLEEIQPAIQQMQNWGFKIKIGNTIGKRDYTFGGTDEDRARDFQQMLDDNIIKAIMCARGGYGTIRIIDRLNFNKFKQNPKWIIGFSDITIFHCHLNRNYGIASIHSKMCNSFPDNWSRAEAIQQETIFSIKQALTGVKMKYTVTPNAFNKLGKAQGAVIGGNLKIIETLSGTKSDLRTVNKILFVEDTGEYLYSIDRMFWNLKRTGKLSDLKGLIIGGFKIKPDDAGEEFGKTIYDIVLEKVKEYDYPVLFDFPVGHQKNNFPLKCGMEHVLDVGSTNCSLKEI